MSNIPDWIQAISGVATGILALVAYFLSRGMYHAPFKTFLRPIKTKSNDSHQVCVHIYNVGPGIAFNVSVKSLHFKNLQNDPLLPGQVWYEEDYIEAEGPEEIKPDKEEVYAFEEYTLLLSDPIIVSWETITGKQIKSYWKYSRAYKQAYFTRLRQREVLKFKMVRLYKRAYSPIARIKKERRLKKSG